MLHYALRINFDCNIIITKFQKSAFLFRLFRFTNALLQTKVWTTSKTRIVNLPRLFVDFSNCENSRVARETFATDGSDRYIPNTENSQVRVDFLVNCRRAETRARSRAFVSNEIVSSSRWKRPGRGEKRGKKRSSYASERDSRRKKEGERECVCTRATEGIRSNGAFTSWKFQILFRQGEKDWMTNTFSSRISINWRKKSLME